MLDIRRLRGLSHIFIDRGRSPKPANPSEDVKPETQDNETILE